jgi:hypothetical protein
MSHSSCMRAHTHMYIHIVCMYVSTCMHAKYTYRQCSGIALALTVRIFAQVVCIHAYKMYLCTCRLCMQTMHSDMQRLHTRMCIFSHTTLIVRVNAHMATCANGCIRTYISIISCELTAENICLVGVRTTASARASRDGRVTTATYLQRLLL